MSALTRARLDDITCATPDCDHAAGTGHVMYFHPRCHIRAHVTARYEDGVIAFACAQCGEPVCDIKVAES